MGNKKSDEQPNESLQASYDELSKKHQELSDALEMAESVNEELQAKLDSKPAVMSVAPSLPIVKHKGAQYQFTCGKFWLDNELHTAEAAAKNKDMIEKLIDMGFGCLVEV